jgi:protein TonB
MHIKNLLLPIMILCASTIYAQDTAKPEKIFMYVEQMPTSGYDYGKFIADNLHYPEAARKKNIEGRVTVKFIVHRDGSIGDVTVVRGIGGGCDEEAKRVVSMFPKWKPAMQSGKPVSVYFNLPIMFRLTDDGQKK